MAIGRITYEDKIDSSVNEQDPKYKITAQDMNEIKQVFNESAEDIEFATGNLGDYKVENGVIYFKKADGSYNEQGVSLAGQSSVLDGNGNVILSGNITPNDNLLTNSDYTYSVINQKGKLSYSASNQMTYTIDMWRIYNGTLSVVNEVDYNGWKYSNNTSTEHALEQLVDLQYDTYTLMVDLTDISGNCRIKLWGENDNLINEKPPVDGINILNGTGVIKKVQLCVANGSFVFKKAKLEKGSYFTGMPAWNKTLELLKCKSKFRKIPQSFFGYGMNNYIYIITDTEDMNKIPSIYQVNTGTDYGIVLFSDSKQNSYMLTADKPKNFGKGYLRIDLGNTSWNNWRFTGYFKDCDIFADSYDY